jgi:hypothetical protein
VIEQGKYEGFNALNASRGKLQKIRVVDEFFLGFKFFWKNMRPLKELNGILSRVPPPPISFC